MNTPKYYRTIKKILDPPVAAIIFLAALPLFVVIALLVAVSTGKNPFFSPRRAMALGGRDFTIVTFRTMYGDDAQTVTPLNEEEVFNKPFLCDTMPPVCRFLRRTGLDELPQLINVMKGDMSIIGPRPFDLHDLGFLAEADRRMNERRKYLPVRPGITGLWQIYGKRSQGSKNLIALDEEYVLSLSFALDIRIMLETLRRMVLAKHEGPV
jgi:exopolysaccharide production protein ExoY